MILYVNGDSHAAAAEAVNPHGWACDDSRFFYLGQAPHPDNLAVSWSRRLADALKLGLINHAQSGGSNDRIVRTLQDYFSQPGINPRNHFVIIQWSTWERTEWLIDDQWYQINGSGMDAVPKSHQQQYRDFVNNVDWIACTKHWHDRIWEVHQQLIDLDIPHVFFNGNSHFGALPENERFDWGKNYIAPYDPKSTYDQWLRSHGFDTVAPNSWHFGKDAHSAWSRFVLQYIVENKMIA